MQLERRAPTQDAARERFSQQQALRSFPLLEKFLAKRQLVQHADMGELAARLSSSSGGVRILYGETFDEFGHPLDCLKYYLALANLVDLLKSEGIDAKGTVLIADFGVIRNEPEQEERIKEQALSRLKFVENVKREYKCDFEVLLMSELVESSEFKERLAYLQERCSSDAELLEMVRKSVPDDKLEISEKQNFIYTYEELAAIHNYDIKLGPPRESLYDDISRAIAEADGTPKLAPIYLTPSYPFAAGKRFYDERPDVAKYGITPYKSNSKSMARSRIVVGVTTKAEVRRLFSTTPYLGEDGPNPVRDLAVIVDLARQRAEGGIWEDFTLWLNYEDKPKYKGMLFEQFLQHIFKPFEEKGLWSDAVKAEHYAKLDKSLGLEDISAPLLERLKPHPLLARGYFFAHEGLELILDDYDAGKGFVLVSGRGPSGQLHMGHAVLFKFVASLQKQYGVPAFIPFSDEEKFLRDRGLTMEQVDEYRKLNHIDMLAFGFDPANTRFHTDTADINRDFYVFVLEIAKLITVTRAKATFGLDDERNVGEFFYPAVQVAHVLYPTMLYSRRALVPIGIDQHDYVRLTRDIAERLSLPKPSAVVSRFLMSLGSDKMSSSNPAGAIYMSDTEADVAAKLKVAFTGGKETAELQRKEGGNPSVCPVYDYWGTVLPEAEEANDIYSSCRSGKVLCGPCKDKLKDHLLPFLNEHRKITERIGKDVS